MAFAPPVEAVPGFRQVGGVSGGGGGIRLLVVVPAYNPGSRLGATLQEVLRFHPDVWLLVDGGTDGSDAHLEALFGGSAGFRVIRRRLNKGKGATVLEGAQLAVKENFTHILCFDADGQHPPHRIPEFRASSQTHPEAIVMGEPVFGRDAPVERVYFRRLANFFALLETGGRFRWDSLFGMRVYPVGPLVAAFAQTRRGRGYDFETEIAVRMIWNGVGVVGIRTPVIYPDRSQGGISHFHYVRDNLVLAGMHAGLLGEALLRFVRQILR